MNIKNVLVAITEGYLIEKERPLKGNSLAQLIRNDGARSMLDATTDMHLIAKGSPGEGQWADVPWLALYHPEISSGASTGFYIVYLFSSNMERVYLCIGQSVTAVKNEFAAATVNELDRRNQLIRSRIPEYSKLFTSASIDLAPNTPASKGYGPAVAFSKLYQKNNFPTETELTNDLLEMEKLYLLLISRGGTRDLLSPLNPIEANSENHQKKIEERKKYTRHRHIERNGKITKKAKEIHGHICQACNFDFEYIYGECGREYIEAHHLIPLHTLNEGESTFMCPKEDFAVLCSNCHRMVHRANPMLTINELKNLRGVKTLSRALNQIRNK